MHNWIFAGMFTCTKAICILWFLIISEQQNFLNLCNSRHPYVCLHGYKCKLGVKAFGFNMQSHQLEWMVLKLRGGVVIPVLPLPGAEGLTSTVTIKAVHQQWAPGAYKRMSKCPVLIILHGSSPRNQTIFRFLRIPGTLFQATECVCVCRQFCSCTRILNDV